MDRGGKAAELEISELLKKTSDMLIRKPKTILCSLAATAALIVLYPGKATTAPACQVVVVNGAGQGLAHVDVYRNIQDYSWFDSEKSQHAVTDNSGSAWFPLLQGRLSPAAELAGCIRQILSAGAHASCGVYSDISAVNGHLVETARSDQRVDRKNQILRLTMADCPSGDYWTCRGYPHR
jgi:hypothetical protein